MKNIEEIKKTIEISKSSQNLLCAIIYKSRLNKIPTGSFLYKSIFEIQRETRSKELLAIYTFDESGITPFSDKLYSDLFCLSLSNIIVSKIPGYRWLAPNKKIIAEKYNKFNLKDKIKISKMGRKMLYKFKKESVEPIKIKKILKKK